MDPMVSVIYVNFNTSGLLLESAASLQSQCTEIPYEIIIIDNASEDHENDLLQKGLKHLVVQNVRVIFSKENLGFGKANNMGVKHAKGSYLFFLNPDTVIVNDVLSIFFNFLNTASRHVAACGGKLLKPDLSPNDSYGNFPGIRQELAMTGLGFRFFMKDYTEKVAIASVITDEKLKRVPYIVGADIFIRKESFELVGGFDENYFLFYEETDLFRKLHEQRLESFVLPQAHIVHLEGSSLNQGPGKAFSFKKFSFLLKSKLHYYSKWYPSYKVGLIRIILLGQILAQFLKGKMGSELKPLLNVYFDSRAKQLPAIQTRPDYHKKA